MFLHLQPQRAFGRAGAAVLTVVAAGAATPCAAQQPTFRDSLLDRFAGRWVLSGTIAGKPTTHDVTAEWVLGHHYLRVHEVARERGADGQPAYQADVYVARDPKTRAYTCVWLDNTPGGVDAQSLGRAPAGSADGTASGDSVAFLFRYDDGSRMHTAFVYDRAADRWAWRLDAEPAGEPDVRRPFARVTLTRGAAPAGAAVSRAVKAASKAPLPKAARPREACTRLRLEDLANVGPSIAADLRLVGVAHPRDLAGRDPVALYDALCAATGARHDPCVLDVFLAAVRFMEGAPARPWRHYTPERERLLRERLLADRDAAGARGAPGHREPVPARSCPQRSQQPSEAHMKRVTGVGGIFFKAKDAPALRAWYQRHLGIDVQPWGGAAFDWADPDGTPAAGTTAWSIAPAESRQFAPSDAPFMVNYRVADLHALLAALRAEGCHVLDDVSDSEYGAFGGVVDPEGNKVELWHPPAGG